VLAGDIGAILNIFQSPVSNEKKLIWIIAEVLLPVLGPLLWFFLGPRTGRSDWQLGNHRRGGLSRLQLLRE
jgi:Phospholipase_D-nuclease N-terminal